MSKSYGNAISLNDSPTEMFGKIMSIPDNLVARYFQYVSNLPPDKFSSFLSAHPREGKANLAQTLVALYHDHDAGKKAGEEFDRVHRDKGLPDEIPSVTLLQKSLDVVTLLKEAGLAASKSEARRLVEQGGVRIDQEKISDPAKVIDLTKPVLVQCGRRKFAKVQYRG